MLLTTLALSCGAELAPAASWIEPNLPLAKSDQLEMAVSGAEGIVYGRYLYRRAYTATSGYISKYFAVIPYATFRGLVDRDTVLIGLSSSADGSELRLRELEQTADSAAVFFLRYIRSGVLVNEEPWAYSGVLPASAELASRVKHEVARQQPDSLLARSDLVIVGRRVGGVRCPDRPTITCFRVAVDQTLKGAVPADTVLVAPWHIGDIPRDSGLFFLRRVGDGVYEPIAFRRGCLEVQEERVPRLDLNLDELRARVRAVARGAR